MSLYFAKSTMGFYLKSLHKGKIPDDAVEITPELHSEILKSLSESASIQLFADDDGAPYTKKRVPSTEQLLDQKQMWIEKEIVRVRDEMEKVQDLDPQAIGTVSAWRSYRKLLRAWGEDSSSLDISSAPAAPDK